MKGLRTLVRSIKREVLFRCIESLKVPVGSLEMVDLCCGNADDMSVWEDAGIQLVVGLDHSKYRLKQAMQRYKTRETRIPEFITYRVNLKENHSNWIEHTILRNGYPLVSMHYGMEYLCADITNVLNVIGLVDSLLQPSGFFILTCPVPYLISVFTDTNYNHVDNQVYEMYVQWKKFYDSMEQIGIPIYLQWKDDPCGCLDNQYFVPTYEIFHQLTGLGYTIIENIPSLHREYIERWKMPLTEHEKTFASFFCTLVFQKPC